MAVVTLRLSGGDTVSLDADEQQMHLAPSDEQVVSVELEPEEHQLYISETEPHDDTPQTVKNIWTGTCSTAATTATKVVTLDDADDFELEDGVSVLIYFSNGQTASNPALNVSGTGAKYVYYIKSDGTAAKITTSALFKNWGPGLKLFTYQSSSWIVDAIDHSSISVLNTAKADLASPAFTGTPKAPTASSGTATTQIATTAFVQQRVNAMGLAATGDGTVTLGLA